MFSNKGLLNMTFYEKLSYLIIFNIKTILLKFSIKILLNKFCGPNLVL
jgi:hypothetical protein